MADPLSRSLDDIIAERQQEERSRPKPAGGAGKPVMRREGGGGGGGGDRRRMDAAGPARQARGPAPPRLGTKKLFIGTFNRDGARLRSAVEPAPSGPHSSFAPPLRPCTRRPPA